MTGIVEAVVVFAAGCIMSSQFWAGILLGPVVKHWIVKSWAWARWRFNF